jgi:hypothetical protein
VDMYYGLPPEERLPPPPATEIAPSLEVQPQPKHHEAPPPYHFPYLAEWERHAVDREHQPEQHDVPSVPLLAFEEPSPKNVVVQGQGFFADVAASSSETAQAQPSSTLVSQATPPPALPSTEAFQIALPVSGESQVEAEVALPAAMSSVAQAPQPPPRTSQDAPFSAPSMEWDATR